MFDQGNLQRRFGRHLPEKEPLKIARQTRPVCLNRCCGEISAEVRKELTSQLSFLQPHHRAIHSLVVVGSTAYNTRTTGSDIDIVIITKQKDHEKLCGFLFEKEITDALNNEKKSNFEFTVLSFEHVKELFQISSPFAYSIRHGVVLRDDGFLLKLRNKRFPSLPQQKYYITCLQDYIATPYFGLLKKFQKETRTKGCSFNCMKKNRGCQGLLSVELFANLILKMLYVTLPSRGMVPLTKGDVVTFAKMAYGTQGENVAKHVVDLMRGKNSSLCFGEFILLKKFAVQQYKEILNIAGLSRNVRNILRDAAGITKKDFQAVNSPSMKNCVV